MIITCKNELHYFSMLMNLRNYWAGLLIAQDPMVLVNDIVAVAPSCYRVSS